jgi:hypothetical protein
MFKTFQPVPAEISITYPDLGRAWSVSLDGGFLIARGLGVGVHYANAGHDGSVVLTVTVPHPIVPNGVSATATKSVSYEPVRRERSIDFAAVYSLGGGRAWRGRLFAGPTFFWFAQRTVTDFTFGWNAIDQAGNVNLIHVADTVHSEDRIGRAWGAHAGGDLAYFFKPAVGIGIAVRHNRARTTMVDPVTGTAASVLLGHATVGIGIRTVF